MNSHFDSFPVASARAFPRESRAWRGCSHRFTSESEQTEPQRDNRPVELHEQSQTFRLRHGIETHDRPLDRLIVNVISQRRCGGIVAHVAH